MFSGCFSWCPRLGQSKRQSIETEEHHLAIVEAAAPVPAKFFMEPESDEILPENTREIVPMTTQYIMATGKQALELLQSAASAIPVPFLQDAIEVAIKIIKVCEDASAVQEKVKQMQERVAHLMIVIVDNVTVNHEEGSEVVVKAVEGIEKDVKDLLRTLKKVEKELTEICKQNEWLQGLYTDLNMDTVDSCLSQLSIAQERFKLSNDFRDSNLLVELHGRLNKISKKIDDMHKDVKDVAEDVKDVAKKVENISTYLLKSKRSATMLSSDTVVRHQTPLKPEIFHGRDDLVDQIARLLMKKETAHVCLLGPGGMGKTSVSLAVVEQLVIKEQFPDENCVWVPCIEATSATLLLEILYTQLRVPGEKQVTLEKIISYLNASNQPCLILLDNFETPLNAAGSGTQKQIEDILRRLAALSHVAIFITMRGANPPCSNAIQWQTTNIQPTDKEACFRIYHDNDPNSKDDPDVGRLLNVLGYMPFAVTLMAKLGMEGKSTAKELLDAWHESGPDILSDNPEDSMNRSISLSVESNLVKRNPNAIVLLSILSLLPAGTTKQNLLRWWALDSELKISMIPSAIATLSKAALLVENQRGKSDSPVLFVVPVVQSFMQHGRIDERIREQIQASCCQYVLDHACRDYDPAFPVKSKALAAEDTNIQSILFGSPHTTPSDRTIEALIAFSWHRCDTKPDLEIAHHAAKSAKASGLKRYTALALWCLGLTYRRLGDHRSSYDCVREAHLLSDDPSAGDVELRRLHCHCGTALVEVARMTFNDHGKVVSLARDVESKCSALSDDQIHGLSLVRLGSALNNAGQQQEALVHLNRAKIMLKAVKNTRYLCTTHHVIAQVHYREWRFPEALDAIQEALNLTESSDTPKHTISLDFALMCFSANRDTEAWKHTETALMEGSRIGNRLTIGQALELMGCGYLRRGDYENAYGAYEAALEKYRGTVGDARPECKENLARIKRKEKNPEAEVGFYRHCMDVDRSLFYPPIQASASSDMPISDS